MSANRWTDSLLQEMRQVKDPEADQLMELIQTGGEQSVEKANWFFEVLVRNDQPDPKHLPPAAREYLAASGTLPEWADPKLIRQGERLFNLHGPTMVTTLLLSSLPQCYAGADGAQVLYRTGRIQDEFRRRIVETAQFLTDVMAPDGLGPNGKGVRTTQKVRLVHASIRYFLARDPGWREEWGQPINQADLAATLLAFSVVVLDGVERMGIRITKAQHEAYFHCWRVVGHVLGIEDEYLPTDVDDAWALWEAIVRTQFRESEAGRALTKSLIDFVHEVLPGNMLDYLSDVVMRQLMGNDVANMIGVPKHLLGKRITKAAAFLIKGISVFEDHSHLAQAVMPKLNRRLLLGIENHWRGDERTPFQIPPSLRGSWGMNESDEPSVVATGAPNADPDAPAASERPKAPRSSPTDPDARG